MPESCNIAAQLQALAEARADQPALIEGVGAARRVCTFGQLLDGARRSAGVLLASGLRPGDALVLLVPMSIGLYRSLLGAFWAGMSVVVPGPEISRASIAHACAAAGARGLIGPPQVHLAGLFTPQIRRVAVHFSTGVGLPWVPRWPGDAADPGPSPAGGPGPAQTVAADADAPALITFTSGSTGTPKAAVRTHGFLAAQHRALARSIRLVPGEIDLATLPIFTLASLASGLTAVLPVGDLRRPGDLDPGPIVEQIRREGVSRATASPTFFGRLAEHCLAREIELPELRKVFTGGGPVLPAMLRRLARVAPRAELVTVYGSSEAEPIAHVAWSDTGPDDLAAMAGGAGLLAGPSEPEIDLRLLATRPGEPAGPCTPAQFEALCVPPGDAGEIAVRGAHVLRGYLHGRGDAQNKIRVGDRVWHRTGDVGRLDPQRRLWLLGRCEATILRPDGPLFPFAVECAASESPGLARSALVELEGRVVLVVEPRPDADAAALREDLAHRLAWARLDAVETLSKIPVDRRHQAKIDYHALRAAMGASRRRQ